MGGKEKMDPCPITDWRVLEALKESFQITYLELPNRQKGLL